MPPSARAERRLWWAWILLAPGLLWLTLLYLLPLLGLLPLSLSEPLSRFGLDTRFSWRLSNHEAAARQET